MGDKGSARAIAAEAGVPVLPGSPRFAEASADDARRPRRRRPAFRSWSRPRAAAAASACAGSTGPRTSPAWSRRPSGMAARAFGDGTVYLERLVSDGPAHRGAGLRLRRRPRGPSLRARMLDPAPLPEGDRGGAIAGPRRGDPRQHDRGGGGAGREPELCRRRHRRVHLRRRHRGVLLPRDEHPHPGRARGDRDDHRSRPRADAAPPRRRRRLPGLRPGQRQRRRPRHRAPRLCRESGEELHALAGQARPRAVSGAARGIRVDTGFEEGDEITPHYDPLIAKLIVHGEDRDAAMARGRAMLRETAIEGPSTNLALLRAVLDHPAFVGGRTFTNFLDTHKQDLLAPA